MKSVAVVVIAVLIAVSVALANVRVYAVDPVRADWSGKVSGEERKGVSQTVTCNFDLLDSASGGYVELFGGSPGAGGQYHVTVLTYPGGFPIGSGDGGGNVDHKWVKFKIGVEVPESIVKGKQLEFKFTRDGSDSIQYYYQGGNPYPWGRLKRVGTDEPGLDLCMRVYG